MSPEQILPGQLSLSVLDVPRNLPVKFHQNQVINGWDIPDIEFVWVGGVVQSHFIVRPNLLLRLGWGFDNSGSIFEALPSSQI